MNYDRIILVGYRASGKTTTARALADKLAWRWFDSDTELAAEDGRNIAAIFENDGEAEFRRRESEILRRLMREQHAVVATGGGAILSASNRALLKGAGPVIWLSACPEVIRQRLATDPQTLRQRPALEGDDAVGEVETVLASRLALYASCSDHVVSTDELSTEQVTERILNMLREGGDPAPRSGV